MITQLKPISVLFTVPEDNLQAISKRLQDGAVLPATALDRSGANKIADGTLQTFDSQIDPTTGTIKLRAQFPNDTEALYPNQFVNIRLLLDTHKDVTTMPTAGVQRGVPGTFVYLVNADNTVSVRKIELGVTDGDRVEVRSGLVPGDRIVIDGADKLRDGAKINVRAEADTGKPPATPATRPGKGGQQEAAFGQRTETMNPSQPFILRPVATTLLMIAIMLSGMLAFKFLPVAALPEVDYPTIQVQTFYPGASPDVMTSSVTAPLEVQFGQMPNLNQMSSVSSAGASVITLQFGLTISLDVAEQEVQAAINAAGNLLPADLPAPPIYAKVNPADAPILTLGLTSKTMPLTQVEDFVDTRLAQKISQLPGVGLVSISGGQRPAVRIRADIRKLAAYGLNIDDLRTTLGNANINTPKGNFDGAMRAYTINANDQIRNASDYKSLIVAYKNGSPVRLSDVGDVVDGAQNDKLGAWMNETPAIILNIQRQPGANVISVVAGIKSLLPQLQASLPAAIDLNILTDRTVTIRASVRDVEYELSLAVLLVVLVIFVFLRSARATLIPSLSVPLSLVGTLGAMYLFGFSLNNLSLMALTIATGFVVDDAIVVIENISRYIEEGEPPLQAALRGSEQIGFTIISLTVSLIAVLIPLLFMGDVVGRLFREFAITLSVTILISAVVSLTLVPMACAKLLKPEAETRENAFQRYSREGFDRIIEMYGHALNWVLDRQTFVLLIALGTFALTAVLYVVIPERVLSAAGYRRHPGDFGGAAVGVLRRDGGAAATARQRHPEGSGRRKPVFVHRCRRDQHHAQQRPYPDQSQALRSAQIRHCDGDAAHQGQHRVADRHHALHAAGSGPDHRGHGQPDAIPVHPSGCRSGAIDGMDAQTRRQAEHAAGACRCDQRHLGAGAVGVSSKSTATRPPVSALRPRRSTMRSMIHTASASSPPSSPTRTSTASSSRPIRACKPRCSRCPTSICLPRWAARRCRWP